MSRVNIPNKFVVENLWESPSPSSKLTGGHLLAIFGAFWTSRRILVYSRLIGLAEWTPKAHISDLQSWPESMLIVQPQGQFADCSAGSECRSCAAAQRRGFPTFPWFLQKYNKYETYLEICQSSYINSRDHPFQSGVSIEPIPLHGLGFPAFLNVMLGAGSFVTFRTRSC